MSGYGSYEFSCGWVVLMNLQQILLDLVRNVHEIKYFINDLGELDEYFDLFTVKI